MLYSVTFTDQEVIFSACSGGPLEVPKKFRAADCKTFRRRADVITEKGTAYPLLARQTSTVQCTRVPHSSGGNLPVITFLNIPGVTDEFIKSMCNGMNDHYHRQKVGAPAGHKILTDPSKGEDVLRYTGSSKQYKENYCNRRAVKCRTAGGCPGKRCFVWIEIAFSPEICIIL